MPRFTSSIARGDDAWRGGGGGSEGQERKTEAAKTYTNPKPNHAHARE